MIKIRACHVTRTVNAADKRGWLSTKRASTSWV